MNISCVHGDRKIYPTAVVYIEENGQIYLTVGVVENLVHHVILGQDIPVLPELVQSCKSVNVVTRSQKGAHSLGEEDGAGSQVQGDGVVRNQEISQVPEQGELTAWSELPYFMSDLPDEGSGKVKKSRRRRRQEKMAGTVRVGLQELPDPEEGDTGMTVDFQRLQKQDETRKGCFEQAVSVEEGNSANKMVEGYILREGVLFFFIKRQDLKQRSL